MLLEQDLGAALSMQDIKLLHSGAVVTAESDTAEHQEQDSIQAIEALKVEISGNY